jgi:CheY-like chemotaxis protein
MGRILIAEPHADVRALFEFVVERLGHQPVCAGAGAEAPAVDALIVEPAVPATLELAQRLRARFPELPIVCASIYPPAADALALAPVAYLEKPFGLGRLEQALAGALGDLPAAAA